MKYRVRKEVRKALFKDHIVIFQTSTEIKVLMGKMNYKGPIHQFHAY